MIDALPAKRMLEMLLDTVDFYFPPSQRARYERVVAEFESQGQTYWLERVGAKRQTIADALRKLGTWTEMTDSELLVSSWDDEVLFFYILRTQFLFSRVAAAKPTDMIPGRLEEFWQWGMIPRDDDPWMLFPIFTEQNLQRAAIKPPIWKIPYPHDYPRSI